jgi:adenylate cyclase
LERKLTAILCADVYGYSRLMGEDEEATHRTLTSHRKIIDSLIEQHHGRFVNSAGDSVLAEFASVVNAVQCAVEIQTTLKAENANLPPERRMEFRIGVNLGDVMVDSEQIYGDGVNVAARLESLGNRAGSAYRALSTNKSGRSSQSNYWVLLSYKLTTSGGIYSSRTSIRSESGRPSGAGIMVCYDLRMAPSQRAIRCRPAFEDIR